MPLRSLANISDNTLQLLLYKINHSSLPYGALMECTLKAVASVGKKRYKKSLFLIPYIFTFANALSGFLSVIAALEGRFMVSALYIGLAACMDACDGRLARALGSTSYLGAELDGLCDAISFCCAPPLLLYCFFQEKLGLIGLMALGLYLCSGLFRLAKFNTTPSQNPSYFAGLSTPVSAFFLASFIMYHDWLLIHNFTWILQPTTITCVVITLSFLMISSIPFPSFKNHPMSTISCYTSLILMVLVFIMSILFQLPSILLVLTTYIAVSLCSWITQHIYTSKKIL